MNIKIILLASLSILSTSALANSDEDKCKKMNEAYKQGLELAAEQIKKNPSLANPVKKGLSLQEITKLEKTKSPCEVKALINAALMNK